MAKVKLLALYLLLGEERLRSAVDRQSTGTAEDLLEGVFSEARRFAGKTRQHDDMTIVVVKIA
ncbi:MAG: hypothetical protein COS95_02215 [Ignavibacteriales bacterium CG07_land_8_20_14_0_80_59_12]|nr:MAG: hypothetical protein COS95_02215 [Ignavibacteriales bacterium CG07_land_8_20_14_0_80_59_12]